MTRVTYHLYHVHSEPRQLTMHTPQITEGINVATYSFSSRPSYGYFFLALLQSHIVHPLSD